MNVRYRGKLIYSVFFLLLILVWKCLLWHSDSEYMMLRQFLSWKRWLKKVFAFMFEDKLSLKEKSNRLLIGFIFSFSKFWSWLSWSFTKSNYCLTYIKFYISMRQLMYLPDWMVPGWNSFCQIRRVSNPKLFS